VLFRHNVGIAIIPALAQDFRYDYFIFGHALGQQFPEWADLLERAHAASGTASFLPGSLTFGGYPRAPPFAALATCI
jgi:hypothetical protein